MSTTIAALSTPDAPSAIAVIRLSGPDCPQLARKIFNRQDIKPRMSNYSKYVDLNNRILDETVFVLYKAPASYTGEDMLEISCHGNPFICSEILRDIFARGCQPAQPGEFTRRAFLNDKMDLSQAEAVALTIEAQSMRSLEAAQKQLSGELGRKIGEFSDAVADMLALVEAYIDFPDEDLPEKDKSALSNSAKKLSDKIQKLMDTAKYAPILRGGINIAISGAPNAGKSSLMNAVLGENRAIVSPLAGTTRDVIGERVPIGDHFANLLDTAGLRDTKDDIESQGVVRAMDKIAGADMKIVVIDSSVSLPEFSKDFLGLLSPKDTIITLNKSDLPASNPNIADSIFKDFEKIKISCTSHEGIEELKKHIISLFDRNKTVGGADDILVSARHADALGRAKNAIESAALKVANDEPSELAASDFREALDALGEIVGKTDNEQILDRIFSKFCIGK